jgi:hypothetical protein
MVLLKFKFSLVERLFMKNAELKLKTVKPIC